ncbi:MAG: tyrosine-protein phosphatase [Sandaracinaceae bacterium]
MSSYVDLHCHYVPAVDDGVRTLDESRSLLRGLADVGFVQVIATPHIRTGMFDNRRPGLEAAFGEVAAALSGDAELPGLGLGAEHSCDDVFWRLFQAGEALPYPGGQALLVELPYDAWPKGVDEVFFEMRVAGVRPVLAHPERYTTLYHRTEPIDPLLRVGAVALLDVMSLVGRYGRRPRRAAERMLEDGVYDAACSDAHRPEDVERVGRAIERLRELVGADEARELLSGGPRRILAGTIED